MKRDTDINGIKNLVIDPRMYGWLNFDIGAKKFSRESKDFSKKGDGSIGCPYTKKLTLICISYHISTIIAL